MSKPINFLRLYRKRTPLTQGDIAFLLGLSDESNISRYEKGQREPSIDVLLFYHLLFDTTIESFFEYQSGDAGNQLTIKINDLILELEKDSANPKNIARIKFLESVIIRLTNKSE